MTDVNELSQLTGEFRTISETLRKILQERQNNSNSINVNTNGLRDNLYSGLTVGLLIYAIAATCVGTLVISGLSAKIETMQTAAGDRESAWVGKWVQRVEDAKAELHKAVDQQKGLEK